MKKYLNYTLTALALVALMACSEDASSPSSGLAPDGGKELIAFSQEGSAMTRAAMTRSGFDTSTKVVLRIKAEGATSSDIRYTQAVATASAQTTDDDACNTGYGLVGTHSHLTYAAGQERYWDDAFGRDSKLTVYAVAVPNKSNIIADNILDQTSPTTVSPGWYTVATENTKINWQVSTIQTATTRPNEDITYSNNIRISETVNKGRYHQEYNSVTSNWDKSMEFGRMIWQPKTVTTGETTGKFDQGHLVFKHALSWITIVLNEGSGFNNGANTDFVWTNPPTQNITLKGFPTSGKLDVSTGAWSDMVTNDITQLDEVTTTPVNVITTRQLEAIVLPGTNLYSTTANVIEFEIDNAKYYVTGTQIAEAIRDFYKTGGDHASDAHAAEYRNFTTMEAGKHYFVNLTVSKKGVSNVTAAILDWEAVNSSDATPDNVYCTFTFEDRGTKWDADDAAKFNLYRAAKTASDYITGTTEANYNWTTGYSNTPATKSYDTNHWKTTDWFWPNNLTYYHFRAAGTGASASGNPSITTDATNGDFFPITSGTIDGGTYKDYVWGAPFTYVDNTYKIKYDGTNGFALREDGTTKQISQALGATNSQINMLLFHVTSQIFVTVKTTTGADKVALKDETKDEADQLTKVEILNFLPNGKVLMGTGAASATDGTRTANDYMGAGTWAAESGATPEQVTAYSYGIVPQNLSWTTPTAGSIGLRITTPDGNQYVVKDLSTCTATVSDNNLVIPYAGSSPYTINAWYPHYQYYYTVTLKQAGVANITAAVVAWETVTGDLGEITLEN